MVTIITNSNNKTIANETNAFCFSHIIEFNPKRWTVSEYYYIACIKTKSTVHNIYSISMKIHKIMDLICLAFVNGLNVAMR